MTLRQVFQEFAAARHRQEDARDSAMSLAWHTALFHRIEKMPSFDAVVKKRTVGQPQSAGEQRTVLDTLSARLGIPLKRVRLIRKDAA